MKVVYRLYEIRNQKGLTVKELEKLSGVGKSTINRIESNIANPTVKVICQLAVALDCSPKELFYVVK